MGIPFDPAGPAPRWSLAGRVLFRFAFVYLILFCFPSPFSYVPYAGEWLSRNWYQVWRAVVPWVGQQVFAHEVVIKPTGSGDTAFNYIRAFTILVTAAATAAVWSLVDRRRPAHPRLHAGLRVYLRFYLAAMMIGYGAAKAIKSQFSYPGLGRMEQPLGDMSPMGLLWTFMGASTGYTMFTGVVELVGGLLLTVRRTSLLGALVTSGAMLNVVMLNFCYDVPVKLNSAHYLLMASVLVLPEAGRLLNIFFLNRPAGPSPFAGPLFARRWLNWLGVAVRTAFVGYLCYHDLMRSYTNWKEYGDGVPRSPLYGVWDVVEYAAEPTGTAPPTTDATRWQRVMIDRSFSITYANKGRTGFMARLDPDHQAVTPMQFNRTAGGFSPIPGAELTYRELEPGLVALEGTLPGRKITAKLRRAEKQFELPARGFHWIQEDPYNR